MTLSLGQETFFEQLEQVYASRPKDRFRERAWNRFVEAGLPTKKTEVYRNLKLRALYALEVKESGRTVSGETLSPYILKECQGSCLVFVDGRYRPELSKRDDIPAKVSILTLDDAVKTFGAFLSNHQTKALGEERDPFALLNSALQTEGVFLYVPPKTTVDVPIQILNIATESLSHPKVQAFVGADSTLSLVSSHAALTEDSFGINHLIDLHCEDNAAVSLTQSSFGTMEKGWHLEAVRALLKKGAHLNLFKITAGGLTTRHDYKVHLAGEEAAASLNGLNLLRGKNEAHDNIWIHHHAPNCTSNQLFKTALFDQGHASFEGKIYVEKEAQQTEAYQLNANLLLSDNARAESKPNLEIFADDVRASHGATFGQLEEELLFYLKTRGYSDEAASRALIEGFCGEVLDAIPHCSIKGLAKEMI